MNRKIKNLSGTLILDFLAFVVLSAFGMVGMALAPVKRQKDHRL
jgi:hypothetical protein